MRENMTSHDFTLGILLSVRLYLPRSREMEIRMNLPGFTEPVSLIGSPMKFSRTKVDYRLPPPRVGEHTEQVLLEYGILAWRGSLQDFQVGYSLFGS